jgi:hypothetical protein
VTSIRFRPSALAFLAGIALLAWVSLAAFGGREHLFQYSAHPTHKFTANAILHGSLNLHRQLIGTGHDEQVYNGAGYTNWGFGVPLLQVPFQAAVPLLRRWIKSSYFPDRAIFFAYLVGLLPLLWGGVHRMIFPDGRPASRRFGSWVCSWCAALLILAYSLYELISFRFIVYEETIAYFVVAQLYALACYARFLEARESKKLRWAAAVGFAAALGLLVRPTGLPYLAMWGALVVLQAWRWPIAGAFAGAAAPGTLFWLVSNWIRSGAFFSLGYQNANPGYPIHYQMVRFGSICVSTVPRFRQVCRELFEALFFGLPAHSPILGDCGFAFESRLPGEDSYLPLALLLLFGVSLFWCALRRERRLAYYVPHLMVIALFLAYARAGAGLAWRYAGDFWPVFVLIGLQELRRMRLEKPETVYGFALACVFCATFHVTADVLPALRSLEALNQAQMIALEEQHLLEQAAVQPSLPPRVACGDPLPSWPHANGMGWAPNCAVGVVSNVYLGVPPNPKSKYKLRFEVDRPTAPTLAVYVNSRNYVAQLRGNVYEAEVDVDFKRLRSPVVMTAVEWSRTGTPPPLRLLSIELLA